MGDIVQRGSVGCNGVESMTGWEVGEWERKAVAPSAWCLEESVRPAP